MSHNVTTVVKDATDKRRRAVSVKSEGKNNKLLRLNNSKCENAGIKFN